MKKVSAVCAAVAALFAVGANAGTLIPAVAGGTKVAIENFGTGTDATTTVVTGALTYNTATATVVNANAPVIWVLRLTNGKFARDVAAAEFTFAGGALGGAGQPTFSQIRSADNSTVQITITPPASTNIGLGALVYTPAAGAFNDVKGALGTVGGTVSLTAVMSTVPMAAAPAGLNSTVALINGVDGAVPTETIAVGARAITPLVSSLSDETTAYTNKINVAITPPGSDYTTAGNIVLGSVRFTAVAGVRLASNAADYTLEQAGNEHTASIVVTPGSGQAFPVGAVLRLNSSTNCAVGTAVGAALAAITSATSTTAKTLPVAAAELTSGSRLYVCQSAPSEGNAAAPMTASITATATPGVASQVATTTTGSGYPLVYNGAVVDTNAYWPGSLSQFGYQIFTRIINTGTTDTTIQGALIPQNTGVAGAYQTLPLPAALHPGNVLKAGASVTLSNTSLDTVFGLTSANSADRPRLRVTGTTSALRVQTFMQSANGVITELSSNN